MKRRYLAATGLVAILGMVIAGCGKSDAPGAPAAAAAAPTHESIRMQVVPKMNSIVTILKSVTDEASAKAAAPQIEATAKEMTALKAEDDKLPKLSTDEESAMRNKMEEQMAPVQTAMQAEMKRINALGPAVMAPIMAAASSLNK